MLTYGWLETRDKKPPPHTSLLSSPHQAFEDLSGHQMTKGAGIPSWDLPAAADPQPEFFMGARGSNLAGSGNLGLTQALVYANL